MPWAVMIGKCHVIRFASSQVQTNGLTEIISKLRAQTGLSLSLCRKAAVEANADYERALGVLGQLASTSFKVKADSYSQEGIVGVLGDSKKLHVVEVRCDTDFVALNPEITGLANELLSNPSLEKYEEKILSLRAKFRENISVASVKVFAVENSNQVFGHYLHQKTGPNCGKAVGIVGLQCESGEKRSVVERISSLLARQLVACRKDDISPAEFMQSEYMFDAAFSSVGDFISKHEAEHGFKLSLNQLFSRHISGKK